VNTVHRSRERLDRLLVARGLAPSREKAQALILAGEVLVNNQRVDKVATPVRPNAAIKLRGQRLRYVSRGGLKLEAALDHFGVDPKGRICLDVGASTGGFTDCLLQRGAAHVFAVDVGTNQLDWKLRQDARVSVLEKTNARALKWNVLGSRIDLATMDVSFISSTLILPAMAPLLRPGGELLVLVKPQFELSRRKVEKGGIVRDSGLHREAVRKVASAVQQLGFEEGGEVESALTGAEGNREFFLYARRPGSA